MKNNLTLGSLFDGSGGFPIGGWISGITPLWSSEIEPFPIRVTTKRFPNMKHYGDVSKLNGAELPPVDIITFGSPCQDMSIAGKRAGLDGNRSSLFHEAIRIIKEMRGATNEKYPRYIVWENVPGAFSSNKGKDFKAVIESICSIKADSVSIPEPPKGKWTGAGHVDVATGFDIAWRTVDAQYWGVPQRRKRIYLVADFANGCAGKILFESEGVSRYSAESFRAWQRAAACVESSTGKAGGTGRICLNDQGGERMDVTEEVTSTLRAEAHHPPCVLEAAGFCTEHSANARSIGYEEERSPTLRAGVVPAAIALENHPADSRVKISEDGKVQTLTSRCGTGGGNVPLVMDGVEKSVENPVKDVENSPAVTLKIRSGCEGGGKGAILGCNNDQTLFVPKCYGVCSKASHSMMSDNPHSGFYEADTSRTLDRSGGDQTCNQGGICVVEPVAFTQNQRDEVRNLKDKSAALSAEQGMKQQTFVLQGNMIGRKDENGPQGDGINEDVCFTLDATDRHAVCAPESVYAMTTGSYMQVEKDVAPTLMARDYKDPTTIAPAPHLNEGVMGTVATGAHPRGFNGQDAFNDRLVIDNPEVQPTPVTYTVRRLTPTECARLQGFPDWWCRDLGTENPTEEEVEYWREVFETHRKTVGTSTKPKSEKQIIKWLKDPHSDSAEYKMWGNGVALPNVVFALSGIVWADSKIK